MRKMFFVLATLAIALLAFTNLNPFVLMGKVIDQEGNPIPFASVTMNESRIGISADATGVFSVRVKENDALQISGTGFKSIKIKVTGQKTVIIVLEKSEILFNEIVVTPAFKTKRAISCGQTITATQLNTIRQTNVSNALNNKVTGYHFRTQQRDSIIALKVSGTPSKNKLATDSLR